MKKIIILLLAVLPIFLIVIISFAGKILSEINHIYVESVAFVDEYKEKLPKNYVLEINKGETYQLLTQVYPELATNKKVTYTVGDEEIVTVNESGLLTAVGNKLDTTLVTVKTVENSKTATIFVKVVDTKVSSVSIQDKEGNDVEEITLSVGEERKLYASISPLTAKDKRVVWSSSDPTIVSINSNNGTILAKKIGTVTITVTSLDGSHTDICTVNVDAGLAKLAFDFTSLGEDIYRNPNSGVYILRIPEIKLLNYLIYDTSTITEDQIEVKVTSGSATYNSETGILNNLKEIPCTIRISIKNTNIYINIKIAYQPIQGE